jgi:hypothetical protein
VNTLSFKLCGTKHPVFTSSNSSVVHGALKIRGDLIGMDGHVGLSVSEDDAINCVPDRLFTFLNLVYGGQDIWIQDGNPEDSKSTKWQANMLWCPFCTL